MKSCSHYSLYVFLALGILVPPAFGNTFDKTKEPIPQGQAIYERSCKWCHGSKGNGKGPAAFFLGAYSSPRPRDFTAGNFKLRSTPADEFPTDQDLFRTITNGIPGMMPPFAGLAESDRWEVIHYIKKFSQIPENNAPKTISIIGSPIPSTPESVEKGRQHYFSLGCASCHGKNGRGLAKIALTGKLKDSTGLPILVTDLTNRFAFKNGSSKRDIIRTLLTGMVGTPMPSYIGQFDGGETDAWHIANFILSLSLKQ